MSESRQTHVTLHDIDPQALDQLVQFAYTAEIVVGEGNVQVRHAIPTPIPLWGLQSQICVAWHPYASPQYLVTLCSSSPLLPHPSSCPRLYSQLPAFYS